MSIFLSPYVVVRHLKFNVLDKYTTFIWNFDNKYRVDHKKYLNIMLNFVNGSELKYVKQSDRTFAEHIG